LTETEGAGGVALGVKVGKQDADAQLGESGGEIDGRGGFSHAAFLVGNGDDFHSGRLE
jgi:hypothetical protein